MDANQLLPVELIRNISLSDDPSLSKPHGFSPKTVTKIVGTLGPGYQSSVDNICACLQAGMSVARFDFLWIDPEHHQITLDNLKEAMRRTNKLCAVMIDIGGPRLQVVNKTGKTISLQEDDFVVLTPHQDQEASSELFPINFHGLAKAVKKGDAFLVGVYHLTGGGRACVTLEVDEIKGDDVLCIIKNSATLSGLKFFMNPCQFHIDLPILSDKDKEVISTWGVKNKIDFLSLLHTRHAEDVRQVREYLSTQGDLSLTQIFANIDNIEGVNHLPEIVQEADGIILSFGDWGIGPPPGHQFSIQNSALYQCSMSRKPLVVNVVTRVMDCMTDQLIPNPATANFVANAVLDGCDAILLGNETMYPVETISIVSKICAEAEKVFNQELYFKKTVKCVGGPMTYIEFIASSTVRTAIKQSASVIICFNTYGEMGRLIAKYRPTMPVLSVFIPRRKTNLKWSCTGAFEARQSLDRGLFPILVNPRHHVMSTLKAVLKAVLDYGKMTGVIKSHDRVVFCQKVGAEVVMKILEIEDSINNGHEVAVRLVCPVSF